MKKFAVFCPIKDEYTFSPIWLKYYSRFLPKEDIFILDFNSNNLDHLDCSIIKTDKNIFDAYELFQEIKRVHTELLKTYEYVLPTDVDEILFHPEGLDNFINNFTGNFAKASGYELMHLPGKEPDFDPTKKILEQRSYWFANPIYYDKILITNRTLDWYIGLHGISNIDPDTIPVHPDLLLIHLHRFDYNLCLERHLRFAEKEWSERTVKNNNNWHYREKDIEKVKEWYFPKCSKNITQIPEDLKNLIDI